MQTTDPTYPGEQPADDPEESDQRWMDAVGTVAERAYERLPQHQEIIKRAFTLIAEGQVAPTKPSGFAVATGLKKGRKSWFVNGTCDCPDWHDTPDGICVHKMASMLWTRAQQLLDQHSTPPPVETPAPAPADAPAPPAAEPSALTIPAHYLVEIQGKQFV